MKLYGSTTSPFVRIVRMAAIELGLDDDLALEATVVRPAAPNLDYGREVNPLRRVPALETDEGAVLIDSRVIVEALNEKASGDLLAAQGPDRIACLNRHAVYAGATEALVLAMYELKLRPTEKFWPEWKEDQIDKAQQALDWADKADGGLPSTLDLSALALIALIDYARFRFADIDWLNGRPNLAAFYKAHASRPCAALTLPKEA